MAVKLTKPFRKEMSSFWDAYIAQGKGTKDDADLFFKAIAQGHPIKGLQFLGNKEDIPQLEARLQQTLTPVPWDDQLYRLDPIPNAKAISPGKDLFHDLGLIYLQEPSAGMPVSQVKLKGKRRILDLCAAPGGKSSQLLQRMDDAAILLANEPKGQRRKILQQNLVRLGASDALISQASAEQFTGHAMFDFILVDAPCSGEALFRRKPQTAYTWRRYPPKVLARTQASILKAIWPQLLPGGQLLYSTCTFNSIENEALIADFIAAHDDAEILEFPTSRAEGIRPGLALEHCPETARAYRIFPQDGWGEGQFAILLGKKSAQLTKNTNLTFGTIKTSSQKSQLSREEDNAQWFRRTFPQWQRLLPNKILLSQGDFLFALGQKSYELVEELTPIEFRKLGILLGTGGKDHFKPAVTWASLQDPQLWPEGFVIDFTADLEKLNILQTGMILEWEIQEKGLYLLTAFGRGFGWLDARGESPQWHIPRALYRT